MATITISGLPEVTSILDTSNIPVETTGVTARITGANLKSYLAALPTVSATSGVISGSFSAGSLTVGAGASITGALTAGSVAAPSGVFTSLSGGTLSVSGSGTFVGNVNAANFNATGGVYAPVLAGTLLTAAQPNITSVGTLAGLTVTSTITGNISGSAGNVTYPAQTNITSIGTLTSLSVTGTTTTGTLNAGSISTTSLGLTTLTAVNVNGTNLGGTLQTNAQPNVTSVGTLTSLDVTGNVTASGFLGNLTGAVTATSGTATLSTLTVPSITHSGTTGVGDIGATGSRFGTLWATASSALYADLAECYTSDLEYAPGTVVSFGDDTEVTIARKPNDKKVAGVVSTNPAYLMNAECAGLKVAVALQGRVPCKVLGKVTRGDLLVSSEFPGVAVVNNEPSIGTVIGKALGTYNNADAVGIIEVAIGRL